MNHFLHLVHGKSGIWIACTCAAYEGEIYALGHVPSLVDVSSALSIIKAQGVHV